MSGSEADLDRRGAGAPLVIVHGNGVDHRLMTPLDGAFASIGGWERIYPDLPGFGATPALPGGSAEDLAEWLTGFVDDVSGGGPFALVGSSFGGLLARAVAAALPDRVQGLALLCPVVESERSRRTLPPNPRIRPDDAFLATLDPDDRVEYEPLAVDVSPENWARFRDAVLPAIRALDREANARLAASYALDDDPERAGGTDAPVLIVAGREDGLVGWEDQRDLASRFPNATLAVLAGAGHNAHLDRPGPVRELLVDWLGRVGSHRLAVAPST